jgi:hypothetical protein
MKATKSLKNSEKEKRKRRDIRHHMHRGRKITMTENLS